MMLRERPFGLEGTFNFVCYVTIRFKTLETNDNLDKALALRLCPHCSCSDEPCHLGSKPLFSWE